MASARIAVIFKVQEYNYLVHYDGCAVSVALTGPSLTYIRLQYACHNNNNSLISNLIKIICVHFKQMNALKSQL